MQSVPAGIYLILIAILLSLTGLGQDQEFKTLRLKWNPQNSDTENIKTGLRIAYYYLNQGQSDSGLHYARISSALSKKLGFTKGLASAFNHTGRAYSYLGKPDSSIHYFNKSLLLYKQTGDTSRQAGILNNLGIIYKETGDIQKALGYFFESIKIKEWLKDTNGVANACMNIGSLYSELKDSASAIKYQLKALRLRQLINDKSGVSASLVAIGLHYQSQNQLITAEKFLRDGLKLCEELGEEESIAIALYNLGELKLKQGKKDSSMLLFEHSLQLSRKLENLKGVVVCLETIAFLNIESEKLNPAIVQLREAYSLAKKIQAVDLLAGICDKLSDCLEKSGDFKNALVFYREHILYKDSLFNKENIRKLTSEGLKYEHEKEKLVLQKEQEKKEELAKIESARKNLILAISFLFIIVVSVFSYNIYKRLQENKRQKKIIEEQKNDILASINYAKRIQYALLAHENLLKENLKEHFVLFKPKDIVSGDFYWAAQRNNHFYLAICDSTGHGVPGAFMSLLNISFLNEAISEKNISEPGKIFDHVRQRLIENMDGGKDGMDAILIKLPVNRGENQVVEYAAANNVPILVQNNTLVPLKKDRMPVGLGETLTPFTTHSVPVQKGDRLFLYTDGFADQFGGPKGKKFMYKKLDSLLLETSDKPVDLQKEQLQTTFEEWRGKHEQVDDVCIVGVIF